MANSTVSESSLNSGASTGMWKIYVAATIGALSVGFSDYVRHGSRSTVVALNLSMATLSSSVTLLLVLLVFMPLLGFAAAWIWKPKTRQDAFVLGLGVFSAFSLVPSDPAKEVPVKELKVSASPTKTSVIAIAPAFAQDATGESGSATVTLGYAGERPESVGVSVTNVTSGTALGYFAVQDALTLVGNSGDQLRLAFEAPGYERTAVDLTLQPGARAYTVNLQESSTPIFIQRFLPADAGVALPVDQAVQD